eukprot:Partr_v1_DN26290_c0_g1_i1_m48301 putative Guanine nucleotide binding protein (G protein) alpha
MKLKWLAEGLEKERHTCARSIRENLIGSLKRLFANYDKLPVELGPEVLSRKKTFEDIQEEPDIIQKHHAFLAEFISICFKDRGFQLALQRGAEYNQLDSATYFLEHAKRIIDDDFVPLDDDILRVRNTTFRQEETVFPRVSEELDIKVFDLGGRVGQRKKWMDFFDNVDAIIFIASLSCYDQRMEEDPSKNQMMDTLTTFETVIKHPSIVAIPVIVFLNKIDLFRQKVKIRKVSDWMPDYKEVLKKAASSSRRHSQASVGSSGGGGLTIPTSSFPSLQRGSATTISSTSAGEEEEGVRYFKAKFTSIHRAHSTALQLERSKLHEKIASTATTFSRRSKSETETDSSGNTSTSNSTLPRYDTVAELKRALKQIDNVIGKSTRRSLEFYVTHA